MRYAIIESGGKQYKAVEGMTIEVDRLPAEPGTQIEMPRVLLVADGDQVSVGTPTVDGVQVRATVLEHFRGEKVIHFRYSPKKRIRVRGGHRQQYTRLRVDFIGVPGRAPASETPAAEADAMPSAQKSTIKKSASTAKKSKK